MPDSFIETLTVCAIFVMMAPSTNALINAFIQTPPLWLERQFGLEQFVFPEIVCDAISDLKIPENLRLGHKMEHIFKNCLEGQVHFKLIAHNVAVKRDKRTIGEIDFLLKDGRDGSVLHLELTYKFYLIDPEFDDPIHQLIGPNRTDTFYSKLQKIKNVQFRMPFVEEGKEQLELLNVDSCNIKQSVCFKAQLFAPYLSPEVMIEPFNSQCISGYWVSMKAFIDLDLEANEFYIPPKDEWPLSPYDIDCWMSYYELLPKLDSFMLKKRSPMIWIKKDMTVFERFFVVWW